MKKAIRVKQKKIDTIQTISGSKDFKKFINFMRQSFTKNSNSHEKFVDDTVNQIKEY